MLEAVLFTRAVRSGRLIVTEDESGFHLAVRWFGMTIQLANVTKKELKELQRPQLGVVS